MARIFVLTRLTTALVLLLIAGQIAVYAQSTSPQTTSQRTSANESNTKTTPHTPAKPVKLQPSTPKPPTNFTLITHKNSALAKDPQMQKVDEKFSRIYELFLHILAYESYSNQAENTGNSDDNWMWRSYLARQLNITNDQAEIVKRYVNIFFEEYADVRSQQIDLCTSLRRDHPERHFSRYGIGKEELNPLYIERDALLQQILDQMTGELGANIVSQLENYSYNPHYQLMAINMECQLDFTLLLAPDDPQSEEAIAQSESDIPSDQNADDTVLTPVPDTTPSSSSRAAYSPIPLAHVSQTYAPLIMSACTHEPCVTTSGVCTHEPCTLRSVPGNPGGIRYGIGYKNLSESQLEEIRFNILFNRLHAASNYDNQHIHAMATVISNSFQRDSGLTENQVTLVKETADVYVETDHQLQSKIIEEYRSLRIQFPDQKITPENFPDLKALYEKRLKNFQKIKIMLSRNLGSNSFTKLDEYTRRHDFMYSGTDTANHVTRPVSGVIPLTSK